MILKLRRARAACLQLLNIIQRLSAHLAPGLVAAIEAEAVPHKI
jgi:hypothetical protein